MADNNTNKEEIKPKPVDTPKPNPEPIKPSTDLSNQFQKGGKPDPKNPSKWNIPKTP